MKYNHKSEQDPPAESDMIDVLGRGVNVTGWSVIQTLYLIIQMLTGTLSRTL
jgi:hypothetical protein